MDDQEASPSPRIWSPPVPDGLVVLEHGSYVHARHPDPWGPRAFLVLNIDASGRTISFLSDAASQWGRAPWALVEANASMGLEPMGSWPRVQELLGACLEETRQASLSPRLSARQVGALMLIRAALRLRDTSQGEDGQRAFMACRCLELEIELDESIKQSKEALYRAAHPGLECP